MRIACIVEGHGEVHAVPVLLRRVVAALRPGAELHVAHPIRIPKSRLVRPGELERAIELAARGITLGDGIVVLVDADDDCPAQLGPELLARARRARSDRRIAVVIAKREFEGWFIAAAPSIAGHRGLARNLETPADPEGVKDAKGWLRARSDAGASYQETVDQAALAGVFDFTAARAADSFDKLWRELDALVGDLHDSSATTPRS